MKNSPIKATISWAILATSIASAQADTFDANTQILTIPFVTVGANTYSNVAVQINSYSVLSSNVNCDNSNNLTANKAKLLAHPMTLNQIKQILGCDYNPVFTTTKGTLTRLIWTTPTLDNWIKIYINQSTLQMAQNGEIYEQTGNYAYNVCYNLTTGSNYCN